MKQKILNISYVDWKKPEFFKENLHHMKQNIKSDRSFTLNSHVLEVVNVWANSVMGNQIKTEETLYMNKEKTVIIL